MSVGCGWPWTKEPRPRVAADLDPNFGPSRRARDRRTTRTYFGVSWRMRFHVQSGCEMYCTEWLRRTCRSRARWWGAGRTRRTSSCPAARERDADEAAGSLEGVARWARRRSPPRSRRWRSRSPRSTTSRSASPCCANRCCSCGVIACSLAPRLLGQLDAQALLVLQRGRRRADVVQAQAGRRSRAARGWACAHAATGASITAASAATVMASKSRTHGLSSFWLRLASYVVGSACRACRSGSFLTSHTSSRTSVSPFADVYSATV